ncbi:hypothetical protein KFL_017270010 [Klebsormidium nitens]|uniref:Replication factor A C-terminal domain-containing protein n=1 Tax=Klebsormidium nitens TaxID=105231 RepID=A0A1Y1IXI7_KLENI|nr:hypothetical protein KFL_017270010 [Klebsormidium nitens]|eukprot:GAQ93626.1 hypothetical protein KFL_017270010 [Klebsormidium nitens]
MAHLPTLKRLKARGDVITITGVQYDADQGCSSTRNTTITTSDTPAASIAGIGLTYKTSSDDKIMPWSRVIQTLAGNKWTTVTLLASFLNFTRVDSIVYACYDCDGPASRNPVTRELFCDQGCKPGPLDDACVEVTVTADVRIDAGPDTMSMKIWPNEFALVIGTHIESFCVKPPAEQLENLNTRLKNRSFAMHVRIRENPNTRFSQFQANVIGLDLPPQSGFFSKKCKIE